MRDPIRILVPFLNPPTTFPACGTFLQVLQDQVTLDGIKQFYIYVEEQTYKLATILDLYTTLNISQS